MIGKERLPCRPKDTVHPVIPAAAHLPDPRAIARIVPLPALTVLRATALRGGVLTAVPPVILNGAPTNQPGGLQEPEPISLPVTGTTRPIVPPPTTAESMIIPIILWTGPMNQPAASIKKVTMMNTVTATSS